ncbi:MAG: hypothetical protein AAF236_06855, partial [Verrucomicrobiota bacterium]
AKALRILTRESELELMRRLGSTEVTSIIIAMISGEIFAATHGELQLDTIPEQHLKILVDGLSRGKGSFWGKMGQALKLNVANPKMTPDAEERRQRIEAVLAHPIFREVFRDSDTVNRMIKQHRWIPKDADPADWEFAL